MSNDDGILNVVEHIEGELQRLMRLVATLRRRIEANGAQGTTTSPAVPSPAVSHAAPAMSPSPSVPAMGRTHVRTTASRFAAQREEETPVVTEEASGLKNTVSGGSGYGFVQPRSWRRPRTDEHVTETPAEEDPFERKAR